MLQVKPVVNDLFSSNTYVIFDDEYNYCWLIDIGDFVKVSDAIPPCVDVKGVFLTHTHFDHIYGINDLFISFPQCRIFTAEYGKEALYDEKKNLSFYHGTPLVYHGTSIEILKDQASVDLYPGISIVSYATPGHCPSCMTFVLNDWVFSGDSYIPGVKVVTKLPKGDRYLAKISEKKILQMCERRVLCPGHGKMAFL